MRSDEFSQSIDKVNKSDVLTESDIFQPNEPTSTAENEEYNLVSECNNKSTTQLIDVKVDNGTSQDCPPNSTTDLVHENTRKPSVVQEQQSCHRNIAHKKKRSSVGVAIDSGRRILGDGARRAYKFCCFVISTGQQLINYKDLPKWLQDNDFIRYFYRPELKSFKLCFKSVFSLHSETGNIWTHIIGVLVMMIFGFAIMLRPSINTDGYPYYPKGWLEYFLFSIFFICACTCMTFSWLFHTLSCHSEKVNRLFAKMDYMGISLLITGSSIPVIYFGFTCSILLFKIYLGIILGLCFFSILVSLLKVFATPKLRPLRAGVFLTFGLSNVVPIIHIGVLYGYEFARDAVALYYLVSMGTLYVSGALLYSMRVPERLFPGKITLFVILVLVVVSSLILYIKFQSHQIFHVLVVVAAVVHAFAICKMAKYRVGAGGNICDAFKAA